MESDFFVCLAKQVPLAGKTIISLFFSMTNQFKDSRTPVTGLLHQTLDFSTHSLYILTAKKKTVVPITRQQDGIHAQ